MESKYLNMNEIIAMHPEVLDLEEEEQVQFNHENCDAGRDTKKRLFVRKRDGGLVAYCHHCGLGGGSKGQRSYIKRGENLVVQRATLDLPRDITSAPEQCHVLHNAWLNKYRIEPSVAAWYKIGWSEQNGRTILPIYDGDKLIAYQRRHILPHDRGPKYLTTRLAYGKHPAFKALTWASNSGFPGVLVLTEDILSAIKVSSVAAGWALLGTYLTPSVKDDIILAGFHTVLVWLDDDNPAVQQAQRRIRRMLSPYVRVFNITKKDHGSPIADPKTFSTTEISRVLAARMR